jgi:cytochrome b561
MIKNTNNSFGLMSRILHWLIGFSIIGLLCVGFYMSDLPNSPAKFELYAMHKASGVIILGLVIARLFWRLINIVPNMPKTMPSWQVIGYKTGVFCMYIAMFLMPLSGVTMTLYSGRDLAIFDLITINSSGKLPQIASLAYNIHGICAWAFVFFISMHSLVALYHHFIDKDRLLMRMIKGE